MRDAILAIIDRYEAEADFSGVVLVRQGDEDVVHEARGLAHRGFGIPNTVETRFDTASVGKIFTAAAIMQLVDRGELTLDTRVMPFLGIDGTRISDDVTVYHCLTHTSGIGDDADEEAGEDYELLFVDKPNYSIRETRDLLPQFIHKASNFAPGEGVRYNNVAFVLLGLVIEQATGMSYRDYVRRHVFAPAGMIEADFCAMDGTCPRFAEHYKKIEHEDGTVTGGPFRYLKVAFDKLRVPFLPSLLVGVYAVAIIAFGLAGGNMFQANQMFAQVQNVTGGEEGPLGSAGASLVFGVVVAVIVMLLFGRGKISEMMGDVAKGIKAFKKGMSDEDVAAAGTTTAAGTVPGEPVRTIEHLGPQPAATSSTLADRKVI